MGSVKCGCDMIPKFFIGGSTDSVCRNFVFIVSVLVNCAVLAEDTIQFQKNLPAKQVWAVPGKDVELPCDITPPLPTDNVSMIFWFKDGKGMPFYSLDGRSGPLGEAPHLAMSHDLGSRSLFITDGHPSNARLRIQNVNMHDEGVFRCRVDFINSPTRNFQVNLTLVVQPSAPRVFDAEGREIRLDASVGPFLEGHELFLSCQVTGGRPKPSLTWWYNNTILDNVIDSAIDSYITVNQLVITSLPRSLKGARLECRASSSKIAGDIIREIPIIVYLKPNKVKIVTPNNLLSVHKIQNFKCETSGSHPPAKITWLLDGKPIRDAIVTEEETSLFTSSILSVNVLSEDDGKDLVCRADNPRFPGGFAEDRRQIHVAYPPKVSVKLDPGVTSPLREGRDVTLRCDSLARPSPHSYSWYHDGHLIPYNETAGVLPLDQILTLKNVKREIEGQYACSASNSEGETYSAPFDLIVQYAPRCKKGFEVMTIGAMPYETLVVQCFVDSIPEVTRFLWTYNTSNVVSAVQGAKMENKGNVSTLHFTPGTEDLHSLSCWATNEVGRQQKPCLFYIVSADKPQSPSSCMLRNASHGGLEVSCKPGEDGGLHQSFVLEVNDITMPVSPPGVTTMSDQGEHPSTPLYRVLGEEPRFRLHSLEPGKEYRITVYAENAKGRSYPPVVLQRVKIDLTTYLTDTTTSSGGGSGSGEDFAATKPSLTLILVALTAAAVLLIVGIVAVATVIACRKTPAVRKRRRNNVKPPEDGEFSEAGFGEAFRRRSAQYRASMYGQEPEERISRLMEGPDLILSPVSFSPQSADY